MKTQLTKTLFFLLVPFAVFAQQGVVSGVLEDSEGIPIPGVNITIKGTSIGVSTDFDGNYSISCKVGDILKFNYIGFKTQEVTVTENMFKDTSDISSKLKVPVKDIKSKAYKDAVKNLKKDAFSIPSIVDSDKTYNRNSYFQYNRIKTIDVQKDKVKLSYFDPDIYFEVGLKTINSFQFVQSSNLPALQTRYSQGLSNNGAFVFQGPETGNVFSYGPQLNVLEFDGNNYSFDINGKLVGIGDGNGVPANTYENTIFNTSIKSTHNAFFNISTDVESFKFDVTNTSQKDLYDVERSTSNNVLFNYEKRANGKKVSWNVFVKFGNQDNNQPNINGFQNNLLLNTWVTPPSFENTQGDKLLDDSQRSFSPSQFNNPEWLLKHNRNSEKNTHFITSLNNTLYVSEAISILTKVNYSNFKNAQHFGLVKNTNGFENGYLSDRTVDKNNFNASVDFNFKTKINDSKIDFISKADALFEDLKYTLFQAEGFDAFTFNDEQENSLNQRHLHRNILRLQNKIIFKSDYDMLVVGLTNNSYLSSIQNNKWFLPTLQVKWRIDDIINVYDFYNIYISAGTAYDINDASLLYGNLSHNSLNIRPEESLSYRAINDLFIDNQLLLEEKQSFDVNFGFGFRALGASFDFDITHFRSHTKNTIFPIFENNTFQLKNVADVKNHGFEINLNSYVNFSNNFKYYPKLTFSTYRPKVNKLLLENDRLPIAGFSTVSKNLIEGQPAGVIIGSVYERDINNTIIIGNDGFPVVASESKIIGNPIPRFNIGFNNHIKLHNFTLNFLIDFQKGGDVWNGTQNVLNYFGTSQQSANDRNISNFIFSGVNTQGNTNTIPVDFYNPNNDISENRFVRYGFEGVAEDAIVDGSYVNLKSIDVTYSFKKNARDTFLRTLEVGLYANNLITWTKFRGASPYSNLFNTNSARGLNFFNAPLISEVGLKLNFKI
ncbi:carboxypeptidase-like regulatory domain-containing protein [Hyunsoonleella pacifica]|uniref:TonB-dependent receptor n=1 Tax=Hyunsoonleella pacifica TaxID=1080224 RepID=A0A4Q9FN82_9FLAO|nr:carboxypeptidase-like regulatory domain-containing protein [Hyunsoonleella pacifica]TBN14636.1 hypothetical protein EYD46_13785 [Hyunsoonleella pacifica]GGD15444.1 TonB-dependent receptor SusC [Hyunsoonleella pacifica]